MVTPCVQWRRTRVRRSGRVWVLRLVVADARPQRQLLTLSWAMLFRSKDMLNSAPMREQESRHRR